MIQQWIVVEIGCIECGVGSELVGIFDDEEKAKEVSRLCNEHYHWRNGGDNNFEVFAVDKINTIHADFKEKVIFS